MAVGASGAMLPSRSGDFQANSLSLLFINSTQVAALVNEYPTSKKLKTAVLTVAAAKVMTIVN